jgi:hypothetical protein
MDINLALLRGRLALPPMVEAQPDGSRHARLLVYLRSRGRFDVIPIVVPDPVGQLATESLGAGTRIHVAGALSRQFAHDAELGATRIEVVAEAYELPDVEDSTSYR